jgi:hypothetical protein
MVSEPSEHGNKTEAVALAVRRLLERPRELALRGPSRLGAGSRGVDLIAPVLDVEPDAETGREVER